MERIQIFCKGKCKGCKGTGFGEGSSGVCEEPGSPAVLTEDLRQLASGPNGPEAELARPRRGQDPEGGPAVARPPPGGQQGGASTEQAGTCRDPAADGDGGARAPVGVLPPLREVGRLRAERSHSPCAPRHLGHGLRRPQDGGGNRAQEGVVGGAGGLASLHDLAPNETESPDSSTGVEGSGSVPTLSPPRRSSILESTRENRHRNSTINFTCFPQELFKIHKYHYRNEGVGLTVGVDACGGSHETLHRLYPVVKEALPLYIPLLPIIQAGNIAACSLSWLSHDKLYESLLRPVPRTLRPRLPVREHDINSSEWNMLLLNGYVERCVLKPKCYVSMWGVDEVKKCRRRLIVHPKTLNMAIKTSNHSLSTCDFPSSCDIRQLVLGSMGVVEIDMRCWFYQFNLEPAVRPFFAIRRGSADFQFTKLPMGFSMAPRIANDAIQAITYMAWNGLPVRWVTVIDNVYGFVDDKDAMQILVATFEAEAARVGATIGSIRTWVTSGLILGVEYDILNKTTNIPSGFLDKHKLLFDFAWSNATLPPEVCWQLCSVLIWSVLAKGLYLGRFLEVIKLMGRIGRSIPCDSRGAPVWSRCPEWKLTDPQHLRIRRCIAEIVLRRPQRIVKRTTDFDAEVYTDAATGKAESEFGGLGVVILKANDEVVVQSKIDTAENINELEMKGLLFGASTAHALGIRFPRFHVDSSVVFHQVKRGMAASWTANADLQRIFSLYADINVNLVRSEENLADEPSRSVLSPSIPTSDLHM